MNPLTFDFSGSNGISGNNGVSGAHGVKTQQEATRGFDGSSGTPGHDGSNARDITAMLRVVGNEVLATINDADATFPLGDRTCSIVLRAKGGNGGPGGRGGSGGEGARGIDGTSYLGQVEVRPAKDGADGGNGGSGGPGGNGGAGGKVSIHVLKENTDLLMLTGTPDVSGGTGGAGGLGAAAGGGGKGGSASPSLKGWDAKHMVFKPQGASGKGGVLGNDGAPGEAGPDGSLRIHVSDGFSEKIYNSPYDLSLVGRECVKRVAHELFEPGEHFTIQAQVRNTGGMPLPEKQAIKLFVKETVLVRQAISEKGNEITLPTGLDAGDIYQSSEVLHARIPEVDVAVGTPFNAIGHVKLGALVERVNREFVDFDKQRHMIPIAHAAHLLQPVAPAEIRSNEEAPIVVRVNNVSQQALGAESSSGRTLRIALTVSPESELPASRLEFVSSAGTAFAAETGLVVDTSNLEPNTIGDLMATVRLATGPNQPTPSLVSRVRLLASLYLDSPAPGGSTRCIQEWPIEMKIHRHFQPNPNADVLLVTNPGTTDAEVQSWQDLAQRVGLTFSVWNSAAYGGLSFTKHFQEFENTLAEEFAGKTIVVLNQEYGADAAKKTRIVKSLPQGDLLSAVRHDIHCYTLGGLPAPEPLLPSAADAPNLRVYNVSNGWRTRRSAEEKVDRVQTAANDTVAAVRKQHPLAKHLVEYTVNIADGPNAGSYRIHPMGTSNTSRYLHANWTDDQIRNHHFINSDRNAYALIKMLPFGRKLQLLSTVGASSEPVQKAVLSDLIDEQAALRQGKWMGNRSPDDLTHALTKLDAFIESIPRDSWVPECYRNILLPLRVYAEQQVATADRLLPRRLNRILTEITLEKIAATRTFRTNIDYRAALEHWFPATDRPLAVHLRDPYHVVGYQDNRHPGSTWVKVQSLAPANQPVNGNLRDATYAMHGHADRQAAWKEARKVLSAKSKE